MKLHPLSLNDADNKLIVLSSEALFFTRPVSSSNQIEDETLSLLNSSYSRGIHIRRWYFSGINATLTRIDYKLLYP